MGAATRADLGGGRRQTPGTDGAAPAGPAVRSTVVMAGPGFGSGEHRYLRQLLPAAFLSGDPGRDYTGGEFALTEQRPRMKSRAEAAVSTVNQTPRSTGGRTACAMRVPG